MIFSLALILLGLMLVLGGFWGSARWSFPYATLAAWLTPVGLLATLIAVLLLIIPDFF